jgi:GT2 family glycosyltransferase
MANRPAVRYFRQAVNAGPAAARNVGIRSAIGEWILFLDDDVVVARDTLALHLAAHAHHPGAHIAVLGLTRVAPDMNVTPLMRGLVASGPSQLTDLSTIADADDVPFGNFQTNTSVARSFLLDYGCFDEDFRFAYGDDTELAYRLAQHGLRIVFRPEIIADHYGSMSYEYARRRARLAGKVAIMTYQKHPEWVDIEFLKYGPKTRASLAGKRLLAERVIDPILLTADLQSWDHPILVRAGRFSLGVQQLGEMFDTAKAKDLI